MFFTCVYKSVVADYIYANGHKTFVSCGSCTALVFKQYCWKWFTFEGSFI